MVGIVVLTHHRSQNSDFITEWGVLVKKSSRSRLVPTSPPSIPEVSVRMLKGAQMRGGARRPHARRTLCTVSVRPRANEADGPLSASCSTGLGHVLARAPQAHLV